ncbi:MAG: DUF4129 domain-containing protein [Roseiflexus sp.]
MLRLLYIYYTIVHVLVLIPTGVTLCVSSISASVQPDPPDISVYESWLREGFAAAQRGDRIGLEEVADRLVSVTAVRFPDGTMVAVDNAWLQAALASPTPDLPMIGARFGALIDALAHPPLSAPADSLERLERILDAPPFNRPVFEPPQWLADVFDWLAWMIETVARPVGVVPPEAANVVAWVFVLIGVALLLVVMVYLVINVRRGIVHDAQIEVQKGDDTPTATEALDRADTLARNGDYRGAVRCLYLSALLWLDEQGLLRYDRTLTNHEHLERARSNPDLLLRLKPVIETFDHVWYGHAPVDASLFAMYREQIKALRHRMGIKHL